MNGEEQLWLGRIDDLTQNFNAKVNRRLNFRARKITLIAQPLEASIEQARIEIASCKQQQINLNSKVQKQPKVDFLNKKIKQLREIQAYNEQAIEKCRKEYEAVQARQALLAQEKASLQLKLHGVQIHQRVLYSRHDRIISLANPPPRDEKLTSMSMQLPRTGEKKPAASERIEWDDDTELVALQRNNAKSRKELDRLIGDRNRRSRMFIDLMSSEALKVERKIVQLDSRSIHNKQLFIKLCESIKVCKDEHHLEKIKVLKEISWQEFKQFQPKELLVIMGSFPLLRRKFKPLQGLFLKGLHLHET